MIKIDRSVEAILLNRYVAYVTERHYTRRRQKKAVIRNNYVIQWQNIVSDIKGLLHNPIPTLPRVAYSLAAFYFIFLGKHLEAYSTAFFAGTITYDAVGQTSHSGEPATISYTHTIGSGSDKIIVIFSSGLSGTNAPTFGGNATTSINTVGNLRTCYYLSPSTGTVAVTGGNIKVAASISFTDVDQTSPIDASTTEDGSSSPNGMSLTTVAANAMRVDVLGANRDDASTSTGTLDTGTLRNNPTTPQNQFRISIFSYTDLIASAGSATRTWTTSGFSRWYSAFSLNPSAGGGGSAIKTVNNLAKASVKTVNGLAIASVKTWDGLA